jgi:amylosucrase
MTLNDFKIQVSHSVEIAGLSNDFVLLNRINHHVEDLYALFHQIYSHHSNHEKIFVEILDSIISAHIDREKDLKKKDYIKSSATFPWYLSNEITGMSLYVDRFAKNISGLAKKLPYLENLGVNLLHLMPLFESPENESDGGYAVSNFKKVDARFGTMDELKNLRKKMAKKDMYLMMDIVLNHTSNQHEWAMKAKSGDKAYQDCYYFFDNREIPDSFDYTMPEIFPESAPGNFTYIQDVDKWVMTVFHDYQWDLNFFNPVVFKEMLQNVFFYANLGVDILRIDAPAFIWKQQGTSCQNLPQAHILLRLIKCCVQIASPGMAILGEAIVSPKEIMKYFGTGDYTAKECDFAYNATHMALQWDMLATGDTKIMLHAQEEILKKPMGTSWITYTRCHDDIGLGYDDEIIYKSGYDAFQHRKFLKEYYSGQHPYSTSRGALFSSNPKTGDARISGSLASLCGLEYAINENNDVEIALSINKIMLMQAHSFFLGGVPMLFYGDEAGYLNDYHYLQDPSKNYDNRWMHRPIVDWIKNSLIDQLGTIEHRVFYGTKKLIAIRKNLTPISDFKNLQWLNTQNDKIAGYLRTHQDKKIFCLFNFSNQATKMTWYVFKQQKLNSSNLYDHWSESFHTIGYDHEYIEFSPYQFYILEVKD